MILTKDLIFNHFNLIFTSTYFFQLCIFENIFRENLFDFFSGSLCDNIWVSFLFLIWLLLIFNKLRWWFFHKRPLIFEDINTKILWARSFERILICWDFAGKYKVWRTARQISVFELVQILEWFVNKEKLVNRSAYLNFIDKLINIDPALHEIICFVIISFKVIKLYFHEKFFQITNYFFKFINDLICI